MPLEIFIKYFDPAMPKLEKIEVGDWIDLRNKKREVLFSGKAILIPLGVAMKLPSGYEAIIAPRSSTFKHWGAIQTNSLGIVDESYSGDDDEWQWTAYPTKDSVIEPYSRICQFRIQLKQPPISFIEVSSLGASRGGFGSTGIT